MFFLHYIYQLSLVWSLFFWNNVEDKLGKFRFILFLCFSGIVSVAGHSFLNSVNINPIVGSSGIVSALMGAYLYLFPNARLLVLVPFGVLFPTTIKAMVLKIF